MLRNGWSRCYPSGINTTGLTGLLNPPIGLITRTILIVLIEIMTANRHVIAGVQTAGVRHVTVIGIGSFLHSQNRFKCFPGFLQIRAFLWVKRAFHGFLILGSSDTCPRFFRKIISNSFKFGYPDCRVYLVPSGYGRRKQWQDIPVRCTGTVLQK